MIDVKRFNVYQNRREIPCEPDGEYVLWDDYKALRREWDGLRESLERIHRAADEASADPVQFRVLIRAECRKALKASDGGEVTDG